MKERLIIIFVALVAGLFITSTGFFIYQSTKKQTNTPISKKDISPTPVSQQNKDAVFVKINEPQDESIANRRTITIKGVTNPNNIIIVSTNLQDVQGKPTQEGNFSLTIDIDQNANQVITRAVAPDGSKAEDIRTVTYSSEEF